MKPSMENLPTEVTVDILTRLPVKTIIHCKCVSKKLENLINSSYFINLHLSRSPTGLMVQQDADDATPEILEWVEIKDKHDHHRLHFDPVINFDFNRYLAPIPPPLSRLIPVGSVNGLICISHQGHTVDNVHICNPITREYLTLPKQQYYNAGNGNVSYNFGINSSTGEYKVLRIFQGDLPPYSYESMGPSLLEAEIYTIGTSQWRSLGQIPYEIGYRGTFLNHYFHWIVHDERAPEKIITFDLDKETFQLFPSPPIPTEFERLQEFSQHLGVFKGCLCKSDKFNSEFTIWVMMEYGIKKSWHKELVFTQSICASLDLPMEKTIYVFGGLQDGSILLVYQDKLLAYYPERKTIKTLQLSAGGSSYGLIVLALSNSKTLIQRESVRSNASTLIFNGQ